MDLELVALAVAGAAAARAYAPDARALLKRLLGASVRVGAAEIAAQHHRQHGVPVESGARGAAEGDL
ncbi:hypothetical protein ABZ553_40895 [Streptomyces sparsogenes]|uniref:hypothetical protein n=1 Tax=Streptomyces sparsogenes TaxID=67365 RepID=UPI0033CCED24